LPNQPFQKFETLSLGFKKQRHTVLESREYVA